MRVVWTGPALLDLTSARRYIARDRPVAADRQVGIIVKAAAGLAMFPQSGRRGRLAGTRELVVGTTRSIVLYRERDDKVEILRVLHGRQKWPDSL